MDYRDEVFLAVAENLSFSKAAEDLCISQPAVTKHVKELENRWNVALFERIGNKISLTDAGKMAVERLKDIRWRYRELEFGLGRLNGDFFGQLRLGASSTISQYVIPEALAAFHKRYPQVDLTLLQGNSSEMEEKLLAGEIDIALVENETSEPGLRYEDFLDDEIVTVTGVKSAYADIRELKLEDFSRIPLVLREKGSGTLQVLKKALQKKGVKLSKLNILLHLGSTEAIKNFLADFDGVALVSAKAIEKELLLEQLVRIRLPELSLTRKFRSAYRMGPLPDVPRIFTRFLEGHNL
ncbi:transcriptional regulator (plasmid) [Fulvitalea axinellae]|uniref:Transcriptional regulator n=1 Tax=Fulvitalea axinellae TaxID=1182444 RepID=A0AAU9DEF3_9BACT|nr:transcriptional regulator [Fulvitalea axinellae]